MDDPSADKETYLPSRAPCQTWPLSPRHLSQLSSLAPFGEPFLLIGHHGEHRLHRFGPL